MIWCGCVGRLWFGVILVAWLLGWCCELLGFSLGLQYSTVVFGWFAECSLGVWLFSDFGVWGLVILLCWYGCVSWELPLCVVCCGTRWMDLGF